MCETHRNSRSGRAAVQERPAARPEQRERAKGAPGNLPPVVPGITTPKPVKTVAEAPAALPKPAATTVVPSLAEASLPKALPVPVVVVPDPSASEPITSVQNLLNRKAIAAIAIVPAGYSKDSPDYLKNITATLEMLHKYEQGRKFNSTEFGAYKNKSLYLLYLQCFPEDSVRYSSMTNFISSACKGREKATLSKLYKKLDELGLASGGTVPLPRYFS